MLSIFNNKIETISTLEENESQHNWPIEANNVAHADDVTSFYVDTRIAFD